MGETVNEIHTDHQEPSRPMRLDWYQIGKWGAIGIIAYYLLTEHFAHDIGVLPFLILLACPLMHFFMHGGHGSHSGHSNNNSEKKE